MINDTLFLERELAPDYYHAVFVDANRESENAELLTDFRFDRSDSEGYDYNKRMFSALASRRGGRAQRLHLPSDWLPLVLYHGNYYLYAPSDFGNAGKLSISDTALTYWFMDGIYPLPFLAVEKKTSTEISIAFRQSPAEDAAPDTLTIHILDPVTMVAVFDYPDRAEPYRYELYTPAAAAARYGVVVNYCRTQKQPEYEFEKPDYRELLDRRR